MESIATDAVSEAFSPGKNSPAATQIAPGSDINSSKKPKNSATPTKWQRDLLYLYKGGSLNRFEAVRELRDWCLNTTISQLEARGIKIAREDECVSGAFGPVHCKRYRLASGMENRARAAELLELPYTEASDAGAAPAQA